MQMKLELQDDVLQWLQCVCTAPDYSSTIEEGCCDHGCLSMAATPWLNTLLAPTSGW
jgi:hypothetical protein